MQNADQWLSGKTVGWTKLACSIHNVVPILEMRVEQTPWPCDPNKRLCGLRVNTRNHFHNKCGIALSSPLLTDKSIVVLIVSSYSLFHLLWLCLPLWVLGLLEDAPGLVAEVALLGAVLLPVLLVLW